MFIHTGLELILSLFKIIGFIKLITWLGFLKGITVIVAIMTIYRYLLRLFGLHKLHTNDILLLGFRRCEKFNCICLFLFDDFDAESIRKKLIQGVESHPKLNKRLVSLLYLFFWKDVLVKENNNIRILQKTFETREEVINYAKEECDNHVDIFNSLPYDFQIIKYGLKSGGILFKVDHTLSDGLGMDLFTTVLSDNYDPAILPNVLKMENKTNVIYRLLLEILNFVMFPYYTARLLFSNKYLISGNNPFKRNGPSSGITDVGFSDTFSFKQYHNMSKCMGITFNDLCLSLTSAGLSKYSERHYPYSYLVCGIPIGVKRIPYNIKDVQISNDILGTLVKLNRINNVKSEYPLIASETKETIKNYNNIGSWKYFSFLVDEFMPIELAKNLCDNVSSNIDLFISNLPGPTQEIKFNGYVVKDIIPSMSIGSNKCFIIIGTYNDKMRISISVDRKLGIDLEKLISCINNELTNII
jgi:hypothetical protein